MEKFVLSAHAQTVIKERSIDLAWLERVLITPEKVECTEEQPQLRHALGRISEHGDRVLRVIYNAGVDPVRIITVYFDRKMKDKL